MTTLLLAEFPDANSFAEAAQRAQNARYELVDAFSPFPVEGVIGLFDNKKSRIRVAMFVSGIAMAILAYAVEYYSAVIDYPYNSGGRPFDAWPAFMLVPFAIGILLSAISGFAIFLTETGLPRLHHPLFAIEGFERASQDCFMLALARPTPDDNASQAIAFLRDAGAIAVREVDTENTP
jgi:hypothetical protein